MTQTLLLVLLGELSLVLLTGLIVMLVVNRRHKRRRLAGIEDLLEDIKTRQELRGDRLALALAAKYQFDEQSAHEVSETLLAAEKQFLYGFIEQQMQQGAVSGFYENLCQLLDSYLDGVSGSQENQPAPDASAEAEGEAEPPTASEEALPPSAEDTPAENPPPPEWGDVFD